MAYKFNVNYETLDPERRDQFLENLIELIDKHRHGADTAKIKLQFVINNGPGGKTTVVQEQVIEPGQPIPDLAHFGQTPLTPMEMIEGFDRVRR